MEEGHAVPVCMDASCWRQPRDSWRRSALAVAGSENKDSVTAVQAKERARSDCCQAHPG